MAPYPGESTTMKIQARGSALSLSLALVLCAAPALATTAPPPPPACGPGKPVTGRLLTSLRRAHGLGTVVCAFDAGAGGADAYVNGEQIRGDRVIVIYQGYHDPGPPVPPPPPPPPSHGTPPQ
jgi:hypothetical protein